MARSITIYGGVSGNVKATHDVTLKANCFLIGNIFAPQVHIESGADLVGQVIMPINKEDKVKAMRDRIAQKRRDLEARRRGMDARAAHVQYATAPTGNS